MSPFHFIILPSGDGWVARGIHGGPVTQGGSLDAVLENIDILVLAYSHANEMQDVPSAAEGMWELFASNGHKLN